uniref:Retrovirus-related Pol polyprotein from transposon TNT 1-94 n=1 Tax=Cajanus cajan TaxID=3821 RepID=A0A151UAP7_CAJCA|nr:Retrovirus-related Pol polyprotein from transposon TNT 1-94 [Cajanus cajan]
MDINNAFLNGELKETVFMRQPEGFMDKSRPQHICKLTKAIYRLKQVPRSWYDRLRNALLRWGFTNTRTDSSLFVLMNKVHITFLLVYVDYIIITDSSSSFLSLFIKQLNIMFELKDLGSLHYFLGVEVCRDASGLYLKQTKYVFDLLKKINLEHVSSCPTPMVTGISLSEEVELMQHPTLYRREIGALQYLTNTRPDIAYFVNRLSQYMQALTAIHWQSVKHVIVSRSSTKSEYKALANLAAEVAWIRSLLQEIKFKIPRTPILWCDNLNAKALATNPVYHSRTKHIEWMFTILEIKC